MHIRNDYGENNKGTYLYQILSVCQVITYELDVTN